MLSRLSLLLPAAPSERNSVNGAQETYLHPSSLYVCCVLRPFKAPLPRIRTTYLRKFHSSHVSLFISFSFRLSMSASYISALGPAAAPRRTSAQTLRGTSEGAIYSKSQKVPLLLPHLSTTTLSTFSRPDPASEEDNDHEEEFYYTEIDVPLRIGTTTGGIGGGHNNNNNGRSPSNSLPLLLSDHMDMAR